MKHKPTKTENETKTQRNFPRTLLSQSCDRFVYLSVFICVRLVLVSMCDVRVCASLNQVNIQTHHQTVHMIWWWHFVISSRLTDKKTHTHQMEVNNGEQHMDNEPIHGPKIQWLAIKWTHNHPNNHHHHHFELMFILFILHMYKPHYLLQWNFTFVAFRARRFSRRAYFLLLFEWLPVYEKKCWKHTQFNNCCPIICAWESNCIEIVCSVHFFLSLLIQSREWLHKWKIN